MPPSIFRDLTNLGGQAFDRVGELTDRVLDGNLRIGVTGLRRSGKTVFTTALIDNLLQWLEEQRPDLCTAFTPPTLQHKVAYFARGPVVTYAALTDYLDSEAS